MPQRRKLELEPGRALGPFELGQTLFHVLDKILRPDPASFPKVNVAWDQSEAANAPLVITLSAPSPPLVLTFHGPTQRLIRIEVVEKPDKWVSYKDKNFGGGNEDGLKSIYRLLGPTYPPTAHPVLPNTEVVGFPGVAFAYQRSGKLFHVTERTKEGTRITRLVITHPPPEKESRDAYLEPYIHPQPKCAQGDLERVWMESSDPRRLRFEFFDTPAEGPRTFEADIGITTSEDILCTFGAPLRTFWKEDNRLAIHSPSQLPASSSEPNPYFYLYPSQGLTFLFSATSNTLLKVLLHSNLPGEVHWGRNHRCRWTIRNGSSSISESDNLETIQSFFATSQQPGTTTLPIPIPAARSLTPSPPSFAGPSSPSPTEQAAVSSSSKRGKKDKSKLASAAQAVAQQHRDKEETDLPAVLQTQQETGMMTMVLNRGADLDETVSEVLLSRNTELWAPVQHCILELTLEGMVETMWIV
ncbi:hypothetical protein BT69DRAFT_1354373 [Atractiella rhizophila]|nr:hypothetical protein BT69DRAFT_1354373 [Atractiella rhizophila]